MPTNRLAGILKKAMRVKQPSWHPWALKTIREASMAAMWMCVGSETLPEDVDCRIEYCDDRNDLRYGAATLHYTRGDGRVYELTIRPFVVPISESGSSDELPKLALIKSTDGHRVYEYQGIGDPGETQRFYILWQDMRTDMALKR